MTVPRLKEMTEYWKDNPPIHEMIANYFQIGKYAEKKPEKSCDMNSLLVGVELVEHAGPPIDRSLL